MDTTIVTATIAALVAIITYGQWQTNCNRLRHELFDRRYAMFEEIAKFLAEIGIHGVVAEGAPEGFLRRTNRAYFVFGCDKEFKALMTAIYNNAGRLQTWTKTRDSLTDDERIACIAEESQLKTWLAETLTSLEDRFEKYLKLTD